MYRLLESQGRGSIITVGKINVWEEVVGEGCREHYLRKSVVGV